MQTLTRLIVLTGCLLSLGILALVTSCKSDTAQAKLTAALPEMERLLLAADTLGVEALAAEALKLPGTWADSFFQSMHWELIQRQDGPGLKVAASAYEKTRPDNAAAGAFIHFSRGCAYQFAARLDSADIHYKLAQDWYQQTGNKDYLIQVLDCRATNSDLRGKFDEAIALKYQILDLVSNEQRQMYMKTAIAYTLIAKGDSTIQMEMLEAPLRFFEQARDTFTYTWVLTAQANAFRLKQQYAKSIECHQKALLLRRKIGKMAHLAENLGGIAKSLNELGQWQSGLDTAKVAEQILAPLNAKQGIAACQMIAGEALFHLNRLPEADAMLLQNLEDARARKRYPVAMKASLLLSQSKKQQGKPAEALDYQTQHLTFKDSVYSQEKEKIIQEVAGKYETREKQAQIAALKIENQLANQRNAWIAAFLVSLAGAGAWFLRYRHRREKALLEKDIENKRLENEVLLANEKLNRQTIENAAHEIEIHKAQLEEFVALMLEKNTKIEALQSKIEQASLPGESNGDQQNTPNSDDIDALFQASLVTETDWQFFQKHFEKVFPGILNRLKIQYPELSIAEYRLVLLTQMGLKTKETAGLLGISPESVRKLRYRFKKKMGLSEEELLDRVGG
jgi:DNA-binding CsgD family transcriptional regulator